MEFWSDKHKQQFVNLWKMYLIFKNLFLFLNKNFLIEGQFLYKILLVRAKHQHNVLDSESKESHLLY